MDSVIQFEGTIYEDGYGLLAQKVMRDKSLPKQSKLIYAYMCSFAGVSKNGERSAFPSVSLQCAELGMSEDTYYKWRKPLIEKGYIKIKKQRQEGAKFDNNIYSIMAVPVPTESEKDPTPKKSGMDHPYPKNPSTEKSSTENKGTNSNSFNSNSFIKEEEEKGSPSDVVTFLINKGITLENALKFEARLLEEGIKGFTYEQVLKAIEWSLEKFLEGMCDEPYIYAVGRLERVLDGKVKEVASKPKNKARKKKPVRTEKLPNWFEEEQQQETSESEQTEEEKKREIEEMLKRLRD